MKRKPGVTGQTVIVPLVGHPVAQVKAPGPMNGWFSEHGVDAVVVPMDVRPERVANFFEVLRATQNCAGCIITMPHKQGAFAAADEVSERARRAKAVNVMRRTTGGKLVGDMTDGLAMVAALKEKRVSISGRDVLIVGAGGAGAAIAHAIGEEGVASITVIERDQMRQRGLIADLERYYPRVMLRGELPEGARVDIAINASPTGMLPTDPYPYPLEELRDVGVFADAVTKPVTTRWLVDAGKLGAMTQTGEEMALAQVSIFLRYLRFLPEDASAEDDCMDWNTEKELPGL